MLALLEKFVMHAGDAKGKAEVSLAMACSSGKEHGGKNLHHGRSSLAHSAN